MKWSYWRYLLGGALVLMGVLALFQVLGYLPGQNVAVGLIFGVLFAAAGVAFLLNLGGGRENWWAVIPGVVLVSLGLLILFGALTPDLAARWGGSFFLGGISIAFWLVYFLTPQNWWALIPAGTLLTLAAVAGMSDMAGEALGGIFFLGLALTFGVVALVPANGKRMVWAWIPAGVLGLMGLLILLSSVALMNFFWPVALILGGLLLLILALRKRA